MLTINDLKVGAVVVGRNNKIGIVIGHELNRPKNPIVYKNSPDGPSYIGGLDWFKAVIGSVDMVAFNKLSEPLFPNLPFPMVPASGISDVQDLTFLPPNVKAMNLKPGGQGSDQARVTSGRGRVRWFQLEPAEIPGFLRHQRQEVEGTCFGGDR